MLKTLAIISLTCIALTTNAQVFKCKDNSGRTIYSDTACSSSQKGALILREKTFEEKMIEREQAYAAQLAKEERKLREEALERAEAQRREVISSMQPPAPQHKGYAERLAERNASVQSVLSPPKTGAQRGLPSAPQRESMSTTPNSTPTPSVMTHCAGGFCYDNTGGVYHQHGNGTTMTGPNGNTCFRTGSMVNC